VAVRAAAPAAIGLTMRTKKPANFIYLLVGLLFILVGGPVFYEFTQYSPKLVWQITFSLTLVVGIWSLIDNRRWFIAGIALVVADVVLTAHALATGSIAAETMTTILELGFIGLTLVFALDHVLFGRGMDVNRIIGAICVYMLLGIFLGILNHLVYRWLPGSFNGLDVADVHTESFAVIYYTFVTLTTLGYGDITPAAPLARVLSYLGAIVGQFYIAILVAMVVGQYLSQANAPDNDD
jgi:hypothetical protein